MQLEELHRKRLAAAKLKSYMDSEIEYDEAVAKVTAAANPDENSKCAYHKLVKGANIAEERRNRAKQASDFYAQVWPTASKTGALTKARLSKEYVWQINRK